MAATTTYDVNLNYNVHDRASKGLGNIERSAHRAAGATSSLDNMVRRLTAAGGAFLGFQQAKSWLVDYNSNLESARITMSGLLQLNMGGEFAENQKRANALVAQFQQDAKKSTATTEDFVNFAGLITAPLTRAGASMEQLRNVTQGGVIAAKAFGMEGEVAARDIEQALAGTLGQKDRFARALLEPWLKQKGVTKDFTKAWNAMLKSGAINAADALTEAFNQPAIRDMAKAQEKSWAGMTSTLKDNLQRAMGAVGLPLMRAMSAEFEKLNAWFDKNPDKVNAIAKSVSESLVSAFQSAKKVMAFIVDNRKLLMTIAKAYLVGKIAGALGGGIARPFEMLQGTLANTNTSFLGFERGLKGVVGGLGRAMGIIGVAAVGFQAIADRVLAKQEKRIQRRTETTYAVEHAQALAGMEGKEQRKLRGFATREAAQRGTKMQTLEGQLMYGTDIELAKKVLSSARGAGMISGGVGEGKINVARVLERYGADAGALRGMKSSAEMRSLLESRSSGQGRAGTKGERWAISVVEGLEKALLYDREQKRRLDAANWDKFLNKFEETLKDGNLWTAMFAAAGIPLGAGAKPKGKSWNTNIDAKVTIKTVISDDPDRFAFDLIGIMENTARIATQAKRAQRER